MIHFARWKIILIFAVCILGIALAVPNVLTEKQRAALPDWAPKSTLNLGLDLRGGSHLLLEVEIKAAFKERVSNLVQAMRQELRNNRIGYTRIGPRGDTATVVIRDPDKKASRGSGGETNLEFATRLLRRLEITGGIGDRVLLVDKAKGFLQKSLHININNAQSIADKQSAGNEQNDDYRAKRGARFLFATTSFAACPFFGHQFSPVRF